MERGDSYFYFLEPLPSKIRLMCGLAYCENINFFYACLRTHYVERIMSGNDCERLHTYFIRARAHISLARAIVKTTL